MDLLQLERNRKQVARWLLAGVFMIMIQVLIGGITRLTESGLSITEWKPITGALPPLTDAQWESEFAKYRTTDQFKYVHQSFGMSDFKFIFFWEWFHRLWARMMGMVFLAGFIYFIAKRKFEKKTILPMTALFILGALQGAIGWIMVQSGLVPEKYYVGHIELTTHFMAAILLLAYTLLFALSLLPSFQNKINSGGLKRLMQVLIFVLFFQLMYGGLMAGLKAAAIAPTWPDINGSMIPVRGNDYPGFFNDIFNNPITVQFIHRGFAYLLLVLSVVFYFASSSFSRSSPFNFFRKAFLLLMMIQVLLGVLTVLNATDDSKLVWLGVAHQFTGILVTCCIACLGYLLNGRKSITQ
jgi:cytochrome c oxidase assembly protein subunit 15